MGHLLVVDDSPTIRKLVELTFRSTPWTVDFASSGREGISMARSGQPDIVLLDFVLPDMRGVEVCAMLAKEPRTQSTQVILMSAKDESIRQLFKPYPSVVDFVPKPFSSEELLARVRTASVDEVGRPRPTQRKMRFSHAQKEAAAKALYAKLAKAFAQIPAWLAQMGAQNASTFFARKILSPDLIGDLLETLLPVYRELLNVDGREEGAQAPVVVSAPPPAQAPNVDSPLSGRLRGWPVPDVCSMFGSSGRTGELRLTRENVTVIVYYRRGEIVLVSSLDPADHFSVAPRADISATPEELSAAEAEQAASGKPVHVTIAERRGSSEGLDLRRTLQRVGRRLLFDAFDATEQSFAWRDLASLPAYVETYACYVPLCRNTEPFDPGKPPAEMPPSLAQLTLQRLREEEVSEQLLPKANIVFDRVQGFTERIRDLALEARERRVLALIDGRHTIEELVGRTGLGLHAVRRVARSLGEVGLIAPVQGERPVMILEKDVDGFQRSLESMLQGRERPIPVLSLATTDDVVEIALRELPRTVILNVESSKIDMRDTVRALRSHEALQDVSFVALLDIPSPARVPELEAAGFDAVLVKPVAYSDLERWI
ncbi:MAG TPA: response regulator [Labilithrix sp.]|nr:response regulator [Labilithrix sp.]